MQASPQKTTSTRYRSTIGSRFEPGGVQSLALIVSDLRETLGFSVANQRSKSNFFGPVCLASPAPFLALAYRVEMFQALAFSVAGVCLAVAFFKVFSVGPRIRRLGEARRVARWWERRGERWSKSQREGFRP